MQKTHVAEAMSVLTPASVAACQDQRFADKAYAMGADAVSCSMKWVEGTGDNEGEMLFFRDLLPIELEFSEQVVVKGDFVIVGGLTSSDRADHPLDYEGNGRIVHRRQYGSEQTDDFEGAVGLREGSKDLKADVVNGILAEEAIKDIEIDHRLIASLSNLLRGQGKDGGYGGVRQTLQQAIAKEGWEFALDYFAEEVFGVRMFYELPEDWQERFEDLASSLTEGCAERAWEKAVEQGLLGIRLAVPLDIYEHGLVSYSLSGSDATRSDAMWIPDHAAEDVIQERVLSTLNLDGNSVRQKGKPCFDGTRFYQYSVDQGVTWCFADSWYVAVYSILIATGRKEDADRLGSLVNTMASEYAAPIAEQYTDYVNGNCYNACVFVIDRATGELVKEVDESPAILGTTSAEHELDAMMIGELLELCQSTH